MSERYDLAVVGAGIVGLAHALAATERGLRVVVIERDTRANGASIRNFGFITVTGQPRGETWRRARRTRSVWEAVAPAAGVAIEQRGLILALRHPESVALAAAFLETEMGAGCALWDARETSRRAPWLRPSGGLGALWSPHELRVESREAIPRLTAWLAARGVRMITGAAVLGVSPPRIETSRGPVEAAMAVVCPGDDFTSLFADRIAARGVTRCRLSMLRLADPGVRLPCALMSDLGLARYRGYGDLPQAAALEAILARTRPDHLRHGVHLIVVQGADGSLVVGDSHHYEDTPSPFMGAEVEALILDEFEQATGMAAPPVLQRWSGVYPSAREEAMFVDTPCEGVRLVMVTSGTGASTAFAIAEEVILEMFDPDRWA